MMAPELLVHVPPPRYGQQPGQFPDALLPLDHFAKQILLDEFLPGGRGARTVVIVLRCPFGQALSESSQVFVIDAQAMGVVTSLSQSCTFYAALIE